jgi:hypothetical protein
MSVEKNHYEEILSCYSSHLNAVELLKKHRPYLEMMPSMRRPDESLIAIPLPVVQVRRETTANHSLNHPSEKICLPCDIAFLMCDPEWQVKTDVEIFVFIHRPGEDFSEILGRWRKTQVLLSRGYSWDMPLHHQHIFSEGADKNLPLFVLLEQTPERIRRGMQGCYLPFVIETPEIDIEPAEPEVLDWAESPDK